MIQEVLELLVVQGIQRDQFLDSLNQSHGIGFDFRRVTGTLCRVGHFGSEGRFFTQPAIDAKSLHALRNELDLAITAHDIVQTNHATGVGEIT